MKLITALFETARQNSPGIITDYTLLVALHGLRKVREFDGHRLRLRFNTDIERQLSHNRSLLVRSGRIIKHPGFGKGIYLLPGSAEWSQEDQCCFVDPFCYISHYSALQRYHLTNRNPKALTLSTPTRAQWSELRDHYIERHFAGNEELSIARKYLQRSQFKKTIDGMTVLRHETNAQARTVVIQDSFARISSIGQVFWETLDRPHWCGGISHVKDIWHDHARDYLDEIITTISASTSKIVKVRAGYILDELLEIKDKRIESWLDATGRGSSRKLDPQQPFKPTFSEKWMLSING